MLSHILIDFARFGLARSQRKRVLISTLLWTALLSIVSGEQGMSFPPDAPVPPGKHPRLTVTSEELQQVKRKAKGLPWLKEALEGIALLSNFYPHNK